MKYISQPPLLLDVHIHKPLLPARTWMDSLLAFFPGLQVRLLPHASFSLGYTTVFNILLLLCVSQVLKGDIRPAIETHEMLYQVTKKHNFLPEVIFCQLEIKNVGPELAHVNIWPQSNLK